MQHRGLHFQKKSFIPDSAGGVVGGGGVVHWNGVQITQPHNIEVPRSLLDVVVSWNIPMHKWLKTCKYDITHFGSTTSRSLNMTSFCGRKEISNPRHLFQIASRRRYDDMAVVDWPFSSPMQPPLSCMASTSRFAHKLFDFILKC